MTREKAIKMLEYIRRTGNGENEYKNDAQAIAIDMAIKSLEAWGKVKEEIQEQRRQYYTYGLNINPDKILQIIDKHTEELM